MHRTGMTPTCIRTHGAHCDHEADDHGSHREILAPLPPRWFDPSQVGHVIMQKRNHDMQQQTEQDHALRDEVQRLAEYTLDEHKQALTDNKPSDTPQPSPSPDPMKCDWEMLEQNKKVPRIKGVIKDAIYELITHT